MYFAELFGVDEDEGISDDGWGKGDNVEEDVDVKNEEDEDEVIDEDKEGTDEDCEEEGWDKGDNVEEDEGIDEKDVEGGIDEESNEEDDEEDISEVGCDKEDNVVEDPDEEDEVCFLFCLHFFLIALRWGWSFPVFLKKKKVIMIFLEEGSFMVLNTRKLLSNTQIHYNASFSRSSPIYFLFLN